MELLLPLIFTALLFAGVCVSIVPGLPVMLYLLLVSVLFGFVDHFSRLSSHELFILLVLYLVSFTIDFFSGVLGAKYGGASLKSLLYGLVCAVIGLFLMPPFGSIIGLFIGVLIGELRRRSDYRQAFKAASLGVLGAFVGMLINVVLAFIFFGTFIISVFFLN